jgi:hypothetical protein
MARATLAPLNVGPLSDVWEQVLEKQATMLRFFLECKTKEMTDARNLCRILDLMGINSEPYEICM